MFHLGTGLKRSVKESGERGASAVEFALIVPLLLLILFGIIDFGRMYFTKIAITSAAREAARTVAVDTGTYYGGSDAILEALELAIESRTGVGDSLELTVPQWCRTSATDTTPHPNNYSLVTAAYPFRFVTPLTVFVQWFVPSSAPWSSITLQQAAQFRCS